MVLTAAAAVPALAQMGGMAGHDRLDRAMFWTGALIALTPVVVVLAGLGVVLYHRRKRAAENRGRDEPSA